MTRRLVAEGIGTALLLATVVGSGIMGEQLAGGNVAIALLANTLATGAALVALILTFGAVSGAHFNPAVSFADATQGGLTVPEAFGISRHRSPERCSGCWPRTSCSRSRSSPCLATCALAFHRCSVRQSPRSVCSR